MTPPPNDWSLFTLLLIDVQQDFWDMDLPQRFPDFPSNVARLLEFCRSQALEVIHLRASFKPDMSDWMIRYKLRGRIPCIQGTPGVEVLPFAIDRPGEKIIIKQTFDSFHNPELRRYLLEKGKRFVLTAGLVTSTCVLFSTVSAAQSGFLTAVVEDCCADEPSAHQQTLDRYQFIFDRTSVDQIPARRHDWLAALDKLA